MKVLISYRFCFHLKQRGHTQAHFEFHFVLWLWLFAMYLSNIKLEEIFCPLNFNWRLSYLTANEIFCCFGSRPALFNRFVFVTFLFSAPLLYWRFRGELESAIALDQLKCDQEESIVCSHYDLTTAPHVRAPVRQLGRLKLPGIRPRPIWRQRHVLGPPSNSDR